MLCGSCGARENEHHFPGCTSMQRRVQLGFSATLENAQKMEHDPVTQPKHYKSHPSGVECIQITEHMNFCLGNAIKYLWRAGQKGEQLEDLKKARWYLDREISRLEKEVK